MRLYRLYVALVWAVAIALGVVTSALGTSEPSPASFGAGVLVIVGAGAVADYAHRMLRAYRNRARHRALVADLRRLGRIPS